MKPATESRHKVGTSCRGFLMSFLMETATILSQVSRALDFSVDELI